MATFQAIILKGQIHIKQDLTTNIKIRLTHKGMPEYISTDLYVNFKKFSKGQAKGENALFINSRIRDELNKYQNRYLKLGAIVDKLTVKELKEKILLENNIEKIDFIKSTRDCCEELKSSGKRGSWSATHAFLFNLEKYSPSLNFSQIDLRFLQSFEKYLKSSGVGNAVNVYMRYFRLVFNRGRDFYNDEDRGLIRIPHYPFRKYKFPKALNVTQEDQLTVEQMKIFINYKPVFERQQMAKDMFLLMFYLIGINTKDLFYLEKPDKAGRVNYSRFKTSKPYSIKIEPEAIEIINRFKGEKLLLNVSGKYANHMNFQKHVNIGLKRICEGIRKVNSDFPEDVSSNWARHTWATIARNECRIPKDDVALCLGHEDKDNQVTDIYIRYDYSIIDDANRKVIEFIKSSF